MSYWPKQNHTNPLRHIVNAMELAKELQDHDDKVQIIFDGACRFCAKAFGVINEVQKTNVDLLDECDKHPSLRNFIADDYQVVTF
ncbi:hypothetical protein [Fodinibius sp. Rm-B-1B1-1]|uniref:hypothetical protein n=1 Tax=Fodinibius alkaliphilus TaxID=3140241 RepID=UPI00315AAB7E